VNLPAICALPAKALVSLLPDTNIRFFPYLNGSVIENKVVLFSSVTVPFDENDYEDENGALTYSALIVASLLSESESKSSSPSSSSSPDSRVDQKIDEKAGLYWNPRSELASVKIFSIPWWKFKESECSFELVHNTDIGIVLMNQATSKLYRLQPDNSLFGIGHLSLLGDMKDVKEDEDEEDEDESLFQIIVMFSAPLFGSQSPSDVCNFAMAFSKQEKRVLMTPALRTWLASRPNHGLHQVLPAMTAGSRMELIRVCGIDLLLLRTHSSDPCTHLWLVGFDKMLHFRPSISVSPFQNPVDFAFYDFGRHLAFRFPEMPLNACILDVPLWKDMWKPEYDGSFEIKIGNYIRLVFLFLSCAKPNYFFICDQITRRQHWIAPIGWTQNCQFLSLWKCRATMF